MLEVTLVKSFTQDENAGNPTGIVWNAEALQDPEMLAMASKLGFAESVFVLPSAKADVYLRFCAPQKEVRLCGHGTIAAFHAMLEKGLLSLDGQDEKRFTQETKAGLLGVACRKDGLIVMDQARPDFMEIEPDRTRIANLLGTSTSEMVDGLPLQVVSTGTPKLLIPMRTRQGLRAITPDTAGIKAYCLEADKAAQGFYPFTMDSPFDGTDFFARQFNPVADENEDPITGVAAGALGCYSKEHGLYDGRQTFVVAQGYDLKKDGKPMGGNMFVDVSRGVKVGGYAVIYDETRGGGLAQGRE